MRPVRRRRWVKAAVVTTVFGLVASGVVTDGFGLFTDEENASTPVTAGVVDIDGDGWNTLQDPIAPIAAGDWVNRTFTLFNRSTVDMATVQYFLSGTDIGSGLTADDAADISFGANTEGDLITAPSPTGLRVQVFSCPVPYTPAETCPGVEQQMSAEQDITTGDTLVAAFTDVPVGQDMHLRVRVSLPAGAGNVFQADNAVLNHRFYAVQRLPMNLSTGESAPAAPTGFTVSPGDNEVNLSWDPVSGASGYNVYQGSSPLALVATVTGTSYVASTTNNIGLRPVVNGNLYRYTVAAINGSMEGPRTDEVFVRPGVPAEPSNLTVTGTAAGQISVSWDAAPTAGPSFLTGYRLVAIPQGGGSPVTVNIPAGQTNGTVTGLDPDTVYDVTVRAVNVVGESDPEGPVSEQAAGQPGAPTSVTATPGEGQITVGWAAPDLGGASLVRYEIEVTPDVGPVTVVNAGTTVPYVVTGLTNGVSYTFRVRAVTTAETGPWSASTSPVAPVTVPDAPTGVTGTPGNGQVNVTWTAPVDNGSPITDYQVTVSPTTGVSGPVTRLVGGPLTSYVFTGLQNGTAYTFTVEAINAIGISPTSTSSAPVTPRTVPDAPSISAVSVGDGTITVTWNAPGFNGGAAISSYRVTVTPQGGGAPVTVTDTTNPITVTGLTNGVVYTVTVAAQNAAGWSNESGSLLATPNQPPVPPTNLQAVPGDGQIMLQWDAAVSTPDREVTGYRVYRDGTLVHQTSLLTWTATGLTNGTAYTFQVRSYGPGGESEPPHPEVTETPVTSPSVPTNLQADPGDTEVTLTWDAVPNDPGAPVTGYRIYQGSTLIWQGTSTNRTVTGLTNGVTYTFTVAAYGPAGESTSNPSVSATPITVPAQVTDVSVTPGDTQLSVSWTALTDTVEAPLTGYRVFVDGMLRSTVSAPNTTAIITGLTNGTTYQITVAAYGPAGQGTESAQASGVPGTVPAAGQPTSGSIDGTTATVNWTVPDNNGRTITSQEVEIWVSGGTSPVASQQFNDSTTTTATFTGLTRGTSYVYRTRAINSLGTGPWSGFVSAGTTTPDDPTGVVATDQSATVMRLTWNSMPGASSYRVYASTCGWCWTTTSTTYDVTGLTGGALVTYAVRAIASGNPTESGWTTFDARTRPAAPSFVSQSTSGTAYTAQYSSVPNAANYYIQVQRQSDNVIYADGSMGTATSGTWNWGHTSAQYRFRVAAVGYDGKWSNWSGWHAWSSFTLPSTPTGLNSGYCGNTWQYCVYWTNPQGTTSTSISRFRHFRTGWESMGGANNGPNSFYDNTENGRGYWNTYQVVACNAAGCSSPASVDAYYALPTPGGSPSIRFGGLNAFNLVDTWTGWTSLAALGWGMNLDWGTGVVGAGLADRVAAQVSGTIRMPSHGAYCWRIVSDDGHQLFLGTSRHGGTNIGGGWWRVLDNWVNYPVTADTSCAWYDPGETFAYMANLREEYGGAFISMQWQKNTGPGTFGLQVIPRETFMP